MLVRTFLHRIKGTLSLAQSEVPPLQRTGDQYIIDAVTNNLTFYTHQKRLIKCCRSYLQAITIANTSIVSGTRLCNEMLTRIYIYHEPLTLMYTCLTKKNLAHEHGTCGVKSSAYSILIPGFTSPWGLGSDKAQPYPNDGTSTGSRRPAKDTSAKGKHTKYCPLWIILAIGTGGRNT